MKPIILSLFKKHGLIQIIAKENQYELGNIIFRDFPDGESYIRFETDVTDRDVIILDSLEKPNPKLLPLLFTAKTARALGAKSVGLCASYLSYMRQDKQFNPGEGITSSYFADLLSEHFDWLVTIDPHLHRRHNLSEIYSIPNSVLHSADNISQWVEKYVEMPVLIGPDEESEQWVSKVAHDANAPYLILEKIRHGDSDVEVSKPIIERYQNHTPVLVDDIISTAKTMIETVHHLHQLRMKPAVCIGIHAVFAQDAYEALLSAGVADVITCNTIEHPSNCIDLTSLLVAGIKQHIELNNN